MIQCNKHGCSGVELVCGHLSANIDNKSPAKITTIDNDDFLDGLLFTAFHLCEACVQARNKMTAEQKEHFAESLSPVCGKCFDEVLAN